MSESLVGAVAPSLDDRLEDLRTGPRAEWLVVLAFAVALALSTVHWVGLLIGGAIVGLAAPSLPRALQHGLSLGLIVLLAFLAYLWLFGALGVFLATGQLLYLTVAMGLVLPVLGSTVRGIV